LKKIRSYAPPTSCCGPSFSQEGGPLVENCVSRKLLLRMLPTLARFKGGEAMSQLGLPGIIASIPTACLSSIPRSSGCRLSVGRWPQKRIEQELTVVNVLEKKKENSFFPASGGGGPPPNEAF